jgi:hypothetical protein
MICTRLDMRMLFTLLGSHKLQRDSFPNIFLCESRLAKNNFTNQSIYAPTAGAQAVWVKHKENGLYITHLVVGLYY